MQRIGELKKLRSTFNIPLEQDYGPDFAAYNERSDVVVYNVTMESDNEELYYYISLARVKISTVHPLEDGGAYIRVREKNETQQFNKTFRLNMERAEDQCENTNDRSHDTSNRNIINVPVRPFFSVLRLTMEQWGRPPLYPPLPKKFTGSQTQCSSR